MGSSPEILYEPQRLIGRFLQYDPFRNGTAAQKRGSAGAGSCYCLTNKFLFSKFPEIYLSVQSRVKAALLRPVSRWEKFIGEATTKKQIKIFRRDQRKVIMYKKQMIFQKIVCFMALIMAALVFLSSLGFSTDMYDAFSKAVDYPGTEWQEERVPGAMVYYESFEFNSAFTAVSIALVIVTLTLFITNTHSRRKYYIGNYIATGLVVAAEIGVSIWCLPQIAGFKSQYQNNVDFEALGDFSKAWGTLLIGPDDTFWFDICFVAFGILIFTSLLLVLNICFKVIVMKAEQKAIGGGKGE